MELPAYHPFRSAEAKAQYLSIYEKRAKDWPVDSETRMVYTSYGQTFVRISGPAGAPPLVLLPGASVSSMMWAPNIKALSEHYQTYAVDNIYDIGLSVYTRIITRPDDFVNWLDDLFSALELGDKINLMGVSYGGWLTSQYTLRFPNRLAKIVLLAPAATVLPLRFAFVVRMMLALVPHRYFTRSFMHWLFADLVKKDKALIEEGEDDIFTAYRCFKPKRLVPPTVLEDQELQSIQVPTLYLVGENDKIYSPQKAVERLNKLAPQIKTEVIPNAGHDLTIVQAEMVNRKVLEFLKQP
jgi:pimeloyl-ACP methyl ester carboxylesterase